MLIRKAVLNDASKIREIVNNFASEGKMLPISYNQIYERIRDFWVVEENKKIIGCGALKITWKDLGEIRSLAIIPSKQKKGYATKLIEKMFEEARNLGIKKIFVLTYIPEFFEKFGFKRISKSKLPHKIWLDCVNCPKFPKCDEIALMKFL
ncbi:MAG TPA: N-acetyltransferase [Firmicutes bacterium]|nr:MAG: N-acetyltransferase [Candidatus Omnitrophota bacterium]HDD64870.1 N-acetyltransferase [Bacillota bacterium]